MNRVGVFFMIMTAGWAQSMPGTWLRQVAPVITPEERRLYQSLASAEERQAFEQHFWDARSVSAEEFQQRRAYVEARFGYPSDQGRLYLSLGPPNRISWIPSSRVFYPIQIWHYDSLAQLGLTYASQYLFYQRNGVGDYTLYSPTLDTMRRLLSPQAGMRGVFPVNDLIAPSDVRTRLHLSPAEDEVIDAAIGVAKGITGTGNDEILALVMSPEQALSGRVRTQVTSRLMAAPRPEWFTYQSWLPDGTAVVDVQIDAVLRQKIGLRLQDAAGPAEEWETSLPGTGAGVPVRYRHRLAVLPGRYTLVVRLDGQETPFALQVKPREQVGELLVGATREGGRQPFTFGLAQVAPSNRPHLALLPLQIPEPTRWRLLRQGKPVWSSVALAPPPEQGFVLQEWGTLAPGAYELEVTGTGWQRRSAFLVSEGETDRTLLSYNANLSSEARLVSLGRIHLAQRHWSEARAAFARAAELAPGSETSVLLAKAMALQGELDGAREKALAVLAQQPQHFEALALMGYIKAQMQDTAVAAQYYRQALAVHPSPVLERALAALSP